MKKIKNITIAEMPIKELLAEDAELIKQAKEATNLSYSPYSSFAVGAAVLLENGKIVKGANQENVSYPVGICAERSVLATAQNIYPNVAVVSIAIMAKGMNGEFTDEYVTPCGMCRQALSELEIRYKRQIRILMGSSKKVMIVSSIKDLLPMAFY